MERYNLDVSRDTLEKIKKFATACIDRQTWLPVNALGDFVGANLSDLFGSGDLGWSLFTLQYDFQMMDSPHGVYVSVPKPEEITASRDGRTVRDRMEEFASLERPTLDEWLSKNGIGNGAQSSEKVCMQNALAILRRMNEAPYSLYPEVIEQLSEMRTLIHTLIGTGENCCDEPDNEYPEAIRKSTRLDAMDAFSYAFRALLERKGDPGIKRALNSIYSTARDVASVDLEQMYPNELTNVKDPEPNALFVTIETGAFEVTPENIEAVNLFISTAGEGRDIHLRII